MNETEARTESPEYQARLYALALEAKMDAEAKGVERSLHACFAWASELMAARNTPPRWLDGDKRARAALRDYYRGADCTGSAEAADADADRAYEAALNHAREIEANLAEAKFRRAWVWPDEATPRDTERKHWALAD